MSKKPDTIGAISQDEIIKELKKFMESKPSYNELLDEREIVNAWYEKFDMLEKNLKNAKNELYQVDTEITTIKQQLEDKTLSLEMIQDICNTENELMIKSRALNIHIKNLDEQFTEHEKSYHSVLSGLTKHLYEMIYNYLWGKIEEIANPYINLAVECKVRASRTQLHNSERFVPLHAQSEPDYNEIKIKLDKLLPISETWYPVAHGQIF